MLSNSFIHTSGLSGGFVIISDNYPSENSHSDDKKIIILNDEDSSSDDDDEDEDDDDIEAEPLKIIKKSTPPPTPSLQSIDLETSLIKKPVKAKKNIVLMDMEKCYLTFQTFMF